MHRQSIGMGGLELVEGGVEDDGLRVAVGVEQPDRPCAAVASTCLTIENTGVTPLPPQNATTGPSPGRSQNTPAGGISSSSSPAATWSWSQFDTTPPGTRFTVTASRSSMAGALDIE